MKTTNYNIRIDPDIKASAEKTFAAFGLNLSEAINVFLHKSIMERGLPFDVRYPKFNAETLQAMQETEEVLAEYTGGKRKPEPFINARDMLQEILSEEDEGDV